MKNLKFNLKKIGAIAGLATTFVLTAEPMTVYAEEALYVEVNDDYQEENMQNEVAVAAETQNVSEQVASNSESEVGDTLYEETDKTPREYGEDEFIDGDNWSPEQDIDPDAGKEIPDDVKTEAERKGIKIPKETPEEPKVPETPSTPETPVTPVVPEPTPIPKTGEGMLEYILAGGAIVLAVVGASKAKNIYKTHKARMAFLSSVEPEVKVKKDKNIANQNKLLKVADSKPKFRKSKRNTKKLN